MKQHFKQIPTRDSLTPTFIRRLYGSYLTPLLKVFALRTGQFINDKVNLNSLDELRLQFLKGVEKCGGFNRLIIVMIYEGGKCNSKETAHQLCYTYFSVIMQ